MGTHVSFIFRGNFTHILGIKNLHVSWFWGPRELSKVSRTHMAMENPPLEGVFPIQQRSSVAILVFTRVHLQKKTKHHLQQKQPSKKTSIIIVDYNESKGIHSVTFQQDIQCSENTNIFDIFC